MTSDTPTYQPLGSLRTRLSRLRTKLKYYYFINGLNWTIATGSLAVILGALLYVGVNPPQPIFVTIVAAMAVAVLVVVIRHLIYPLSRRIPDEDLVLLIEREYPMLNDRLISALQLARYQGPARQSPAMVQRLTQEADTLAQQIDLRDVLKPDRLAPMGAAAVVSSFLLALTSFGLSVTTNPWRMGLEVSFPQAAELTGNVPRDLNVNFALHPADPETGMAAKLIVAEGSDLVVRAKPRTFRDNRENFRIDDYGPAEVFVRTELGIKPRQMAVQKETGGTGHYLHIERSVGPAANSIWVNWEGVRSRQYAIEVKKPPQIDFLTITYHHPPHMRPREVPLDPNRANSPLVRITPTAEGGFDLEIPVLNEQGQPIREGGRIKVTALRFADEAEFIAQKPDLFRAHVRERVESRDSITGTEGTVVTFRLRANKPLDGQRSYLGVRYKRAARGETVQRQTEFPLDPVGTDHREWLVSLPMDRNMIRYFFVLTDEDGLHQNDRKESPISVQPDQPPTAKFAYTGVALKEGSQERWATPTGEFPLRIQAEDDFGLRSLKLLYQVGDGRDPAVAEAVTMVRVVAKHLDDYLRENEGRLAGFAETTTAGAMADALGLTDEELPGVQRHVRLANVRITKDPADTVDFYRLAVDVTPGNNRPGQVQYSSRRPQDMQLPDMRYEVPGFAEAVSLANMPVRVEVDFKLTLGPMLRHLQFSEDEQTNLALWIVAEDIKVDDTNRGQIFESAPFVLRLISKRAMRAEIRFILRRIIKRQIEDMLRKQSGLRMASERFAFDPTLLEKGIPIQQVFIGEEVSGDQRQQRMFTGGQAARLQDEITRSAAGIADRLDAIVRHYINNDLEGDSLKAEQENTLQTMKVLLLLLSMQKQQAMEINDFVRSASTADNPDQATTAVRAILAHLLGERTPYAAVRRGFDVRAFAQLVRNTNMRQAANSREATLLIEDALSPATPMTIKKERLEHAARLQAEATTTIGEVLTLMRQWEGVDEHREFLRQLADRQRELNDAIRGIATGSRDD